MSAYFRLDFSVESLQLYLFRYWLGSVPCFELGWLRASVANVSYVLEYACRSGYLVCALAAVPLPVRDRNIRQPRRKWPRNLYLLLPSPAPRSLHRSVSFSRSGVSVCLCAAWRHAADCRGVMCSNLENKRL